MLAHAVVRPNSRHLGCREVRGVNFVKLVNILVKDAGRSVGFDGSLARATIIRSTASVNDRVSMLSLIFEATLAVALREQPQLSLDSLCWHKCWGHGLCDPATGHCTCDPGYSGSDCREGRCPNGCSHHGNCVHPTVPLRGVSAPYSLTLLDSIENDGELSTAPTAGGCECNKGWTGIDCSLAACVGDCHGHGTCLNGTCACEPGYGGVGCTHAVCHHLICGVNASPRL